MKCFISCSIIVFVKLKRFGKGIRFVQSCLFLQSINLFCYETYLHMIPIGKPRLHFQSYSRAYIRGKGTVIYGFL